jgi:superfamily II DNA or RNA helicase
MWFQLPSLIQLSDPATFARGLGVYRAQQVLSLTVEWVEDGHWRVSGQVQGTERRPYATEVGLHFMPDGHTVDRWRGHCSCPVGLQCKHSVALLIKAAYQGQALADATPHQRLTPEERTRQQAEREQQQAQAALQQLRDSQTKAAERWLLEGVGLAPGGASAQPAPGQRDTESPIYLLERRADQGPFARLRLSLAASSPKAKGGWSKPRAASVQYFMAAQFRYHSRTQALTEADREVLDLMGALPIEGYRHSYSVDADRLLNGVAAVLVLARAAATGRLFWRLDGGALGPALAWGPELALAWRWVQQEGPTPDEPLWQLQPEWPDAQTLLCANQPQMLYINLTTGVCGPAQVGGAGHPALGPALLQAPPLPQALMLKHQAVLMQRLGDVAPLPPVLPEVQRVGGQPVWRVHLSRVADDADTPDSGDAGLLTAQLDFDYQGCQGWWPLGTDRNVVLAHNGQRVLLTRDLASEHEAVARLNGLGLSEWADGLFTLPPGVPQSQWLDWAETQFQPLRDAGFEVSMDAELQHWVRAGGDLQVDLSPHGAQAAGAQGDAEADISPWFDLSLGLEVEGQRINVLPWLPQLIQSLQGQAAAGEGAGPLPPHIYLPAPDGQGFVRVNTAPLAPWLSALLELFDDHRTDFGADSLRLSRFDALRASVALGEGVAWDGAQQLMQLARQLQGRAELPATPKPAGLVADMRPYQQQGLDWLQFLRTHSLAGILADDMGLGKTLQTLAHIQVEKEAGRLDRPVLVVAPVSLMGNWQREAARFCPELKTLVLHGAERHERADDMAQVDMVIAPYSLLHRDRDRWLAQLWHLVVLDEAQNIKNAATQSAQVVAELNTRHRLCLSGTPIENHLGEIWSLFHFLMPGFLGSQAKFQQRFRNPIEKHGDGQRLAQLRARLTPFILRRTKQLVASELPPKVESVMSVELSGKQADLYETIRLSMEKAVRDAIADKGLAKSQIVFLDALLKLRQVCCDPRLVKTPAAAKVKTSAKLEQLMEMLPEMLAEGRRVLLFSQFTSMLSLIEDELKARNIPWAKLTGQTQKRDEVIERFTSGQVPLFLISLKAGGVGLNLPQADTVIHFDPWWNPAAENQATDRAHRIGQTQSVWVIKLVAQGTIEERILALQERKAELANEIYSGAAGRKQPLFTEDDVRELLKPLS